MSLAWIDGPASKSIPDPKRCTRCGGTGRCRALICPECLGTGQPPKPNERAVAAADVEAALGDAHLTRPRNK